MMSVAGTTFDVEVIAAGTTETRTYADGDVVYCAEDRGDCAFIVKSGKVEIRERGRALEIVLPGEIFGELALLDEEPRTANAIASGPAVLVPIDRAMFEVLVRDDSDFALAIVRSLARTLRATMRMLESCVEDLRHGDKPVRKAG